MGSFSAETRKSISWTVPQGWSEQPPTSMRLGNFLFTASNGQKVEISVVSLPGAAGGIAANFGMWRSQLGLPALEEGAVMKQSETLRVGSMEMRSIDLLSETNLVDGKSKARIVGVIYPREGNTWFFKMKGEDAAVVEAKPSFISFLESVKFLDPSAT